MPKMPPTLRLGPVQSQADRRRDDDRRRGTAQERGYDSRWSKASAAYRREHPLCEYCMLEDMVTPAEMVDHLYPHRRFEGVFWKREWWVASCSRCHSSFKQKVEALGKSAIDELAARLGRMTMP